MDVTVALWLRLQKIEDYNTLIMIIKVVPCIRYEECGPVFVVFLVHFPLVVTMNPDDIKVCLS